MCILITRMNLNDNFFLQLLQEHHDRVSLLYQLATMEHHPESVPINALVAVEGEPEYNVHLSLH